MKQFSGTPAYRGTSLTVILGLLAATSSFLPLDNEAQAASPDVTSEIFAAPAASSAPLPRQSSPTALESVEPVVDWIQLLSYRAKAAGLSTSLSSEDRYIGVADDAATAAKLSEIRSGAWILREGASLKKSLEQMAARAGWHLQWTLNGVDYTVPADVILFGDFDGDNPVILQVMEAYKTAEIPLKASFWVGNRTLVIERAEFAQNDVAADPVTAPGAF